MPISALFEPPVKPAAVNREMTPEPMYAPSFGHAYSKLNLASKVQKSLVNLFNQETGTDKERYDKYLVKLKQMGYENPKIAYTSIIQTSRYDDEFYQTYQKASEIIDGLYAKYNESKKMRDAQTTDDGKKFYLHVMNDLALKANAIASSLLIYNQKYILWAAKDWAKKEDKNKMNIFYELVDANAYVSYARLAGFYNLQMPMAKNSSEVEDKYVAKWANPEVETYYKYSVHPNTKLGYSKQVEDYTYNINEFSSGFEKYSNAEISWFEQKSRINQRDGWFDKTVEAIDPLMEAGRPVAVALGMSAPSGWVMGWAYYGKLAYEEFKEGFKEGNVSKIFDASLISLNLFSPLFSKINAAGQAISGAGKFAAAGKILSGAGKIGLAGSYTAGKIFQFKIGVSTFSLFIDGSKYGLSVDETKELCTNLGFIIMPSALEKGMGEKGAKKALLNEENHLYKKYTKIKNKIFSKSGEGETENKGKEPDLAGKQEGEKPEIKTSGNEIPPAQFLSSTFIPGLNQYGITSVTDAVMRFMNRVATSPQMKGKKYETMELKKGLMYEVVGGEIRQNSNGDWVYRDKNQNKGSIILSSSDEIYPATVGATRPLKINDIVLMGSEGWGIRFLGNKFVLGQYPVEIQKFGTIGTAVKLEDTWVLVNNSNENKNMAVEMPASQNEFYLRPGTSSKINYGCIVYPEGKSGDAYELEATGKFQKIGIATINPYNPMINIMNFVSNPQAKKMLNVDEMTAIMETEQVRNIVLKLKDQPIGEIKKARTKVLKKWRSDLSGSGTQSHEITSNVNNAYDILEDPALTKQYLETGSLQQINPKK